MYLGLTASVLGFKSRKCKQTSKAIIVLVLCIDIVLRLAFANKEKSFSLRIVNVYLPLSTKSLHLFIKNQHISQFLCLLKIERDFLQIVVYKYNYLTD